MNRKSLDPDTNERLRQIVRKVIQRDFDGNVTRAASAKPAISHSLLFEFLGGGRGAGIKLLDWIAARTGQSTDELRGIRTANDMPPRAPTFDTLPGWEDALTKAKERRSYVPDDAFAAAGQMSASDFSGSIDVEAVLILVDAVLRLRENRALAIERDKRWSERRVRQLERDAERKRGKHTT